MLSDTYICAEPKKRKPRIPKAKSPPTKTTYSLHIGDLVLNPLQFRYRDRVEKLGAKVHQAYVVLSKEQAIAFRGDSVRQLFYDDKRDIEVHYEGKCKTVDILRSCRIIKITNDCAHGTEKILMSMGSIEYGKQERE